jgi:hypothetical protein
MALVQSEQRKLRNSFHPCSNQISEMVKGLFWPKKSVNWTATTPRVYVVTRRGKTTWPHQKQKQEREIENYGEAKA